MTLHRLDTRECRDCGKPITARGKRCVRCSLEHRMRADDIKRAEVRRAKRKERAA